MEIAGIHYETGASVKIRIENGFIEEISEIKDSSYYEHLYYVAPGLIDNQVNGYIGVDFAAPSLVVDDVKKAAEAIWKDGVTTFLPTLVTGSHRNLINNFSILSEALSDPFFKGSIPGFHLEGPYLSKEPGFYGCHASEYLRDPSWNEFSEYQAAAGDKIMEITLAPELNGAMELIRRCSESGVVVAIGHSNASAQQIAMAVRNGARLSTHLGNGCAKMIHRHQNPLWPQLAIDQLTPSIIADGHHLVPEEIVVFIKAKNFDNVILTSDVVYLNGLEPGYYQYMGTRILKTNEGIIKNLDLDCLAGASMPLKKGVETVMKVTGCRPWEAINMACKNTARVLGLSDRGLLEPGRRADLILFETVNEQMIIRNTYLNGSLVYSED